MNNNTLTSNKKEKEKENNKNLFINYFNQHQVISQPSLEREIIGDYTGYEHPELENYQDIRGK